MRPKQTATPLNTIGKQEPAKRIGAFTVGQIRKQSENQPLNYRLAIFQDVVNNSSERSVFAVPQRTVGTMERRGIAREESTAGAAAQGVRIRNRDRERDRASLHPGWQRPSRHSDPRIPTELIAAGYTGVPVDSGGSFYFAKEWNLLLCVDRFC